MAALTFAFSQKQVNDLINNTPASQNIIVSMLSAKNNVTSKNNLFLAAQSSHPKSNAPDKKKLLPIGCPVPPGWQALNATINHDQLDGLPKFIIPAAAKKRLLANNSTNNDLMASLNVSTLTFKIKDGNNKIIDTVNGEVL